MSDGEREPTQLGQHRFVLRDNDEGRLPKQLRILQVYEPRRFDGQWVRGWYDVPLVDPAEDGKG